jgi:hypothetical protein
MQEQQFIYTSVLLDSVDISEDAFASVVAWRDSGRRITLRSGTLTGKPKEWDKRYERCPLTDH